MKPYGNQLNFKKKFYMKVKKIQKKYP